MNLQDRFQQVKDYFTANPSIIGLAVAAFGVLLFVGTILKWEWVLSANRRFSLLRSVFGARGQMFVYSVLLVLGGIAIFILL